jgi:hypothetical protein
MSRVFAYVVNEHPFYQRMAAVSMSMLRRHNTGDRVRLFLVEDGQSQTVMRQNMAATRFSTGELLNLCDALGVEVERRRPVDPAYYFANKSVLGDCPEDTVFYLDADTFIFDDPAKLIDRYADVDLAASENRWVWTHGFSKDFLPITPFNTGVMIWNNRQCQRWAASLVDLCEEIKADDAPLGTWLWARDGLCLAREEFSVSVHALRHGLEYRYLDPADCWLNGVDEDYKRAGQSTIFHSYTDRWRSVYAHVFGDRRPRRLVSYVRRNQAGTPRLVEGEGRAGGQEDLGG